MDRESRTAEIILVLATCLAMLLGLPMTARKAYAQEERGDREAEAAVLTLGWSEDAGVPIDPAHFPDPIFREHISMWYDVDDQSPGVLSREEIDYAVAIDVGGMGISDLTGIEYFTQLAYLYCNNNNLTGLDVSGCLNLRELYCAGNRLTSLDISGMDGLEYLNCEDNLLTSLTVAGCAGLKSLSCNYNRLTGLDVRGCGSLEYLSCTANYIPAPTDVIGYSNPPTTDFFFAAQLDPDITYYSVYLNGAKFKICVPGELLRLNDIRRITGLRFGGWTVESGSVTLDTPESNCIAFLMPSEDVRLSTSFEALPLGHNAIWVVTEGGGNVGLSATSGAPGEEVVLTASPILGHAWMGWQGTYFTAEYEELELTIDGDRFIMPEGDVVIAAFFSLQDDGGDNGGDSEGNNGSSGEGPGASVGGGAFLGSGSGSFGGSGVRTWSGSGTAAFASGGLIVDSARAKAAVAAGREAGRARTRIASQGTILVEGDAWSALGDTPADFDTMTGGGVEVRLTLLEPNRWSGTHSLSGRVAGTRPDSRKAFFEKWFQNPVRVICLDQEEPFPQAVEVAAKVNLDGMDLSNLVLYSYDGAGNSYTRIPDAGAWVDAGGYLHFTTALAGDIIVSQGELQRR